MGEQAVIPEHPGACTIKEAAARRRRRSERELQRQEENKNGKEWCDIKEIINDACQ